jgi:hypothetical protein
MIDKKFSNNRKQNDQRRDAGSGAGTEGGKADADWRLELRRMWWGKRSLENACLKATVSILQMCLRVPLELQQCGFFASLQMQVGLKKLLDRSRSCKKNSFR